VLSTVIFEGDFVTNRDGGDFLDLSECFPAFVERVECCDQLVNSTLPAFFKVT